MNHLAILSVLLVLVGVGYSKEMYVKGAKPCPEGTYLFTGCDYLGPQPTCSNPHPKKDRDSGIICVCNFFDCYCNPPTVRDEVSKKCVQLKDCPKKSR